jgi:hypothetical protein
LTSELSANVQYQAGPESAYLSLEGKTIGWARMS